MKGKQQKPRLVFFQWNHERLPKFLQLHMQLHVKCLSQFFEVIVINHDCDYVQICDTCQPDLTLFESGYKTKISQKINIKNTSANPGIPKLGLHNGDSWCDCRAGFLSDMEEWGIDTFFSISTTTAEHTPEIADNLFVWPSFIDSEIYHDYGETKKIPILFTGFMNSLYPWRRKIYETVSSRYSTITLPHSGYTTNSSTMLQGEQYARMINASCFVPTCGTIARDVVRKHFEIPASKSCLITESTSATQAAGFADMQNCVFADEKNVLEKLQYLFQNEDKLTEITNAGYAFVHSNHTLKQRDQIYQWYGLCKMLKRGQKIVQINPFKPLEVVEQSSGITNKPIVCNGLHLELLHSGDEALQAGRYNEAEALYLRCLGYIDWMREPKLKLAICNLYMGNAKAAYRWIIEPVSTNMQGYKALHPDPIEWAYLIVSLLCKGKLNEASIRSSQFPSLQHPELDRIRQVVSYLQNKKNGFYVSSVQAEKKSYTVHQLSQQSLENWMNTLCVMLKACKQVKYAESLSKIRFEGTTAIKKLHRRRIWSLSAIKKYLILTRIKGLEKLHDVFRISYVKNPKRGLPPISVIEYFLQSKQTEKLELVKRFMLNFYYRLHIKI